MRADRLTPHECARLHCLHGRVDLSRIRLHRERNGGVVRRVVLWASRGRAVALGNDVFLPARCERDPAILAHEVTHCAQYQSWGAVRYYRRGAIAQLRDLFHRTLGVGRSPYEYRMEPGKSFDQYGMEQQAMIVQHALEDRTLAGAVGLIAHSG